MNYTIRKEEPKDIHQVEAITRLAFWNEEQLKRDGIGCSEHYLVRLLRSSIAIPELNLVADLDGEIVGHVMLSGHCVITDGTQSHDVLTLAPLTVTPPLQNKGIGSALMRTVLEKAKTLGYGAVILYGDPDYYHRFGFRDAKDYGITTDDGSNFPAFMALELQDGALHQVHGRFLLPSQFDEQAHLADAIAYDRATDWSKHTS